MEFFDHLTLRISLWVDYQSCSTCNYLTPVKISRHFDERNASYEFSRNLQLPARSVNHAFRVLLICPSILWIIPMLGTILLVLSLPYCWSAMFSNLRMLVINSSTKEEWHKGWLKLLGRVEGILIALLAQMGLLKTKNRCTKMLEYHA